MTQPAHSPASEKEQVGTVSQDGRPQVAHPYTPVLEQGSGVKAPNPQAEALKSGKCERRNSGTT